MTRPATALLLCAVLLTACTSGSAPGPAGAPSSAASSEPTESPGSPEPSVSSAPTRTPSPSPRPPRPPEPGACYRLSYAAALAPTTSARPAACDEPHTAETFHVGTLDRVVDGRLLAVDSRRLQQQVATTCPGLLAEHVGGTEEQRGLSMLRAVWFTPSLEQADAGADWFRCDVVGLAGEDSLVSVSSPLAGVLDTEAGRARFAMCGTAEPGTEGFLRVVCSREHAWRALRTVDLPGEAYPGELVVQQAGEDPCRTAAGEVAEDPLDFQWGYEWPTEEQWDGGQTYGICWVPI